ncbi:hypothetical protein Hoch_0953 [Haliangium ochraceum DSM 14365]|uniref:Uncharacterized protein n=1 Tax=Haliangium ochraceum (strain DSM 14365 / JCM 11303 / SMP-2) TaxID=502025 RepID=D0LQJ6_HALO1|nr:hypothetical protein Hoch_0953 [Haliangium ochraceum DSM 14365]
MAADGCPPGTPPPASEAHAARRRAELLAERTARASEIAALSADGRALLDTLVGLDAPARRLVEERLGEIGRSVAEAERELAEAERALLALDEQQTRRSGRPARSSISPTSGK